MRRMRALVGSSMKEHASLAQTMSLINCKSHISFRTIYSSSTERTPNLQLKNYTTSEMCRKNGKESQKMRL